jgi:hypothetical protein
MRYQKQMFALALAGLAWNAYAGGRDDYDKGHDRGLSLSHSTSFSESSADAWSKADAESNARANVDNSGNSKSYSGVDNSGNSKSYSGVDNSGNSRSSSGVGHSGNSRSSSSLEGSGNSKVNASGGNQRQSQGQNVRTGGNRTSVNVSGAGGDGSGGDSFSSKTTVWAPVLHGPAAAPLAGANVVMNPRTCGPRVDVVSAPVVGKRFGVLGGVRDVDQGTSESFVPAREPFLHRGNMIFGHEIVEYVTVLGTSSAGSFSLAGYGTNGNGAQGGASGGGILQQMVVKVSVRECVMSVDAGPPPSVGAMPPPPEQTLQGPALPEKPDEIRPRRLPRQERG